VHWLVDGMNVIGSTPDGWWRDRPGARARLVGALADLADRTGDGVTVVFDGRARSGEVRAAADRGVSAVFAPGGPDAADDVIVSLVAGPDRPAHCTVVSSDAGLGRRVRAAGPPVIGVSAFRSQLGWPNPDLGRFPRSGPRGVRLDQD
jgi:predicted RNA-binding protein with PIN domain